MTTGERIRKRRKELGITADDLGSKVGIDRSTVYRYEKGDIEKVPIATLEPFADALNTTVAYLMGWSTDSAYYDDNHMISNNAEEYGLLPIRKKAFPVLGEIACGKPIYVNEDHESYIMAGTDIRADFCLVAKGDSMINARIYDGDIVFIRKQPIVENGEIAAVVVGDEATLKRVFFYPEKSKLVLNAENSKYEPLVYIGDELNQIRIIGKAVAFQSDVK